MCSVNPTTNETNKYFFASRGFCFSLTLPSLVNTCNISHSSSANWRLFRLLLVFRIADRWVVVKISSDDISFCLRPCIAVGVVTTFGHYGFCRYLVVHAILCVSKRLSRPTFNRLDNTEIVW